MAYQQITGSDANEERQAHDPLLEDDTQGQLPQEAASERDLLRNGATFQDDTNENTLLPASTPFLDHLKVESIDLGGSRLPDTSDHHRHSTSLTPDGDSITTSSFSQHDLKGSNFYAAQDPPNIPDWPQQSSTLREPLHEFIPRLILDIFLTTTPLIFATMALMAFYLNGEPVEKFPWGDNLILLSGKYGVTIFPILFAMIVGSSLSNIASYLLEHGYRLLLLEQLVGSVTIVRAVKTQFLLRAYNWQAVLLLILWALSPLGGQGSLRLIQVKDLVTQSSQNLTYYDTTTAWTLNRLIALNSDGILSKTLATTSLTFVETTKTTPTDLWGNINIPRYPAFASRDQNGWVELPQPQHNFGLIGVPLLDLPKSGSSQFNIKSRHFDFDCTAPNVVGGSGLEQLGFLLPGNRSLPFQETLHFQAETFDRYITFAVRSYNRSVDIDESITGAFNDNGTYKLRSPPAYPRKLAVMQFSEVNNGTLSNCSVYYPVFESSVYCETPTSCRVTQIRNITRDYSSLIASPLEDKDVRSYIQEKLSQIWPATGVDRGSPTEQFLATGSSPFIRNESSSDAEVSSDFSRVSAEEFSARLGLLFNTFYSAVDGPYARWFSGLYSLHSTSEATDANLNGFRSSTLLNVSVKQKVYSTDTPWLIVLLIASFTLLFVGVLGTVARYRMAGNPLFGNVSTLTLNNPYISVPPGGSTLDGYRRARLLKHVKIQVGDLRPEEEIGQIGIASIGGGKYLGALNQKRLYF